MEKVEAAIIFIKNRYRYCEWVLLCVSKKALGVIPWFDHGIQKQLKN
ncbi:hypothetical protein [Rickettsia parkeri]|nr:hypothetical protein [Rickettsia parkeri]